MDDYLFTQNDCPCSSDGCTSPSGFLKKDNHLSEFSTELDKSQARWNLGIPDSWTLKWGNIKGFIELQKDLIDLVEGSDSQLKEDLLEQINIINIELQRQISALATKHNEEVEEINTKIEQTIESFSQQLQELKELVDTKMDASMYDTLVNPENHPYTTEEVPEITNVKQALNKLLYIPLQITSFTVTPNEAETGDTVSSLLYKWTYNKSLIKSQSLDSQSISTSERTKTISGTFKNTTTKTLSASDGTQTKTQNATITFKDGKYYGVSTSDPNSSSIVSSFTRDLNLSKNSTFTVTAGSGQYIYLLVPESLKDIKFYVGGFEGGFTIVNNNFQFTRYSGTTVKCILFKSDNPNLGKTTITIK